MVQTSDPNNTAKKILLARYASGDRSFGAMDLYQANLAEIALVDADFQSANLCGTNLSGADLRGANLSGANLSQANLSGADLRGANLSGANLRRSDLRGAKLEDALLAGARLTGAKLPSGKLFAGSSSVIDQHDLQPLSVQEIRQDLQTIARPDVEHNPIPAQIRSRSELLRDLPKFPLSCLGSGFCLFSLQGAILGVNPIGYALLLLGLWGCVYRSDLAWFMPVLGGMVIFGSGGSSLVVVFGVLIFLALSVGTLTSGWGVKGTGQGALWISGLATVLMMLYAVTLGTVNGYQPGVIVAAMLLTGFGSITAEDMRVKRYPPSEVIPVTLGVAGLGTVLGLAIGLAIGRFISVA
jgi:Pentapeptide repeats (8 copies)